MKSVVLRRKSERAWAMQHPGTATYGKQPEQPPLDVLPPEPRFLMTVVPWYMERAVSTGRGRVQKAGANLSGIAASAGKYTGTVRVIMNEREFYKLQAGDVVVCLATTPMWSVLFAKMQVSGRRGVGRSEFGLLPTPESQDKGRSMPR